MKDAFYLSLKSKLEPNIQIIDIEHFDWLEKYIFSMSNKTAIINFYYNKKGEFKTPIIDKKSSQNLVAKIMELI